ncbi:MAG: DegT/DnrJ/EryC1/StrS family aminotransferase [Planctomycetota bacterium]|nr:DegT/DnrJ/EryC1/StrS family aminotransferase [Planctomycetota bacterium]
MASLLSRAIRKMRRQILGHTASLRHPLRVAVVGYGRIAWTHVLAYEETGTARVVAISDLSAVALAKALEQWPTVCGYSDYRRMLDEVRPDIVSVCTWPQHHAEVCLEAARKGVKAILCEKPLALQMSQIENMRRACAQYGTKLAGGHQYRFHPVFVQAARHIASGSLGTIRQVNGVIRGSMANNGPHLIDTVRFILGDPAATSVGVDMDLSGREQERGMPCESAATATIDFAPGYQAELRTGLADVTAFKIEVIGSQGKLTITPTSLDCDGKLTRFSSDRTKMQCGIRQMRELVLWAKGKQSRYAADFESSAATAELVLAVYESARIGTQVALPLANQGDVIAELFSPPVANAALPDEHLSPVVPPACDAVPQVRSFVVDGRKRAVKHWFSSKPRTGWAELRNLLPVILSGQMNRVGGTTVERLEERFASLYGSAGAVASTSGTAALHAALATVNPNPCEEVITTPLTDMGSVVPILACNCIPVFADVDPRTGNMTAETIERAITPRTRAVILVHLFGRPAELGPIVEMLGRRGIPLIEDCAQAHMAEYDGRKVGTFGDFGCFSLQQAKHITCGDGGITLVNRPEDVHRTQIFVDKGWDRGAPARSHPIFGLNYRMTELQGAVALAQLDKLPRIMEQTRRTANELIRRLSSIEGLSLPPHDPLGVSSYWKLLLGIDEKQVGFELDAFYEHLLIEGVKLTRGYLPRPLFEEEVLRDRHTYGNSQYPFSAVNYRAPQREEYPGLDEFSRRWLIMGWNSRATLAHVSAVELAVRRGLTSLASGRKTEASESKRLVSAVE